MSNFTRIPSNIKSLQMLKKFVNCKNFLQLILILITHAPVVFRLGLWPGMPLYRTVSDRGLWKKNRTKEVRDHLIVLTLTSRPPISVFLSNLSSPTSFLCSPQNLPRTLHLSTSTSQTTSTSHVRRSPTHRYARVALNKSKLGPHNLEKQKKSDNVAFSSTLVKDTATTQSRAFPTSTRTSTTPTEGSTTPTATVLCDVLRVPSLVPTPRGQSPQLPRYPGLPGTRPELIRPPTETTRVLKGLHRLTTPTPLPTSATGYTHPPRSIVATTQKTTATPLSPDP